MPEIARVQLKHGAAGITVVKLSEAEVMADARHARHLGRLSTLEREKVETSDLSRKSAKIDGKRLNVSEFGEDYSEAFFATREVERLREWLVKHARLVLS